MLKRLFFIISIVLAAAPVLGQQDTTLLRYDNRELEVQRITEEDLGPYRNNPDFDYEVVEPDITWWDNFTTWLGNLFRRFFEWLFGAEKAIGFFAVFLRILPYILIGILLFLLIKFFLNVNSNALLYSKSNEAVVSLSEEEHIIKNEDIDQLIQKALNERNYRLAIRYHYLLILKQMSKKELITWEIQKTNDDYINELKKDELKTPFSVITWLYDYVWYGDFPIDEAKYSKAENKFTSLRKTLENYA
ncbi:DUF4129 domain-containing protein [Maribacter polysiphoniae]|uniref:DUF4129 domain-containing protein n=1 Tax=Maribacter polysiphoniae TaxID=429344 RepID=UPI0023544A0E|nr:DUF4129 domain-containing protein [Maribacter polysiphoniae]